MPDVRPIYSTPRKVPQYPGDRDKPTTVILVDVPYVEVGRTPGKIHLLAVCERYELANALEKEGYSVGHPCTHPNGSGGLPITVRLPLHKPLPEVVFIK